MKRKIVLILVAALAAAIFSFDACKQAETTASTLLVLVSDGVTGLPDTGTYNQVVGDQIQYSFTLKPDYSTLTVLFDGVAIAASGTLTLSASEHTLQAYADDLFQCGLTVTLADGVIGTPAAGTFNYPQGTLVDYSFSLADGYYNLAVALDGTVVDTSGTITMSENHTLQVEATAGKKIRGTWLLAETYDDGSTFNGSATFSGNYASGTVIDSDGGSGAYTFIGSTVAFNLVFPNVTYEYTGKFSDDDTMSGTCKRYQTADNVIRGAWIATRESSATATSLRHAGGAGRGGKGDSRRRASQ